MSRSYSKQADKKQSPPKGSSEYWKKKYVQLAESISDGSIIAVEKEEKRIMEKLIEGLEAIYSGGGASLPEAILDILRDYDCCMLSSNSKYTPKFNERIGGV